VMRRGRAAKPGRSVGRRLIAVAICGALRAVIAVDALGAWEAGEPEPHEINQKALVVKAAASKHLPG
jgi:hypothetical protein